MSATAAKPLRKDVRACEAHMIVFAIEPKIGVIVSQQVLPKGFLLTAQPGQRQSRGDEHGGIRDVPEIQFTRDGSQRQQVVIVVLHLV